VLVQPLTSTVYIGSTDPRSPNAIGGPACTVWVIGTHDKTTLLYAPWDDGRAFGWRKPPGANGILGTGSPNADLKAAGRIILR
jgi:hypothetical protein